MTEQTTALPPEPPPTEPPAPKVRRTLALPVVAAIAAAALLIGGLAGGIIGYAVHSDGPDDSWRHGGPGAPLGSAMVFASLAVRDFSG